ncbi:hypothetical protein KOR42_15070 [Thalassoglobus neptunius]|uniref:Planctomycete cytochrome C n=2 Tax=Thalassoglobus neptunius TaxID=1938619 RepID=A0A5C5X542_9PLAN|nr:hypothetical protein KOR42_15070 [Thalassoglobus neptunius]
MPSILSLLLLLLPTGFFLFCSVPEVFAQNAAPDPTEEIAPVSDDPDKSHFEEHVAPFLRQYCWDCHTEDFAESGVKFDRFTNSSNIQEEVEFWEKVTRLIQQGQMPPADADQPSGEESIEILAALERELASYDCESEKHPGKVTLRRLNRPEYDNTIRDLTGLSLNLADSFPADDVGAGFDNIGDVLTIPPVLMEKYLAAAEAVAEAVMADENARQRVFPHVAENDDERVEVARRNADEFASRAFRRPVTAEESQRLFDLMRSAWENDYSVEEIQQAVITAILANPKFLFRAEGAGEQADGENVRHLDNYELASRLSYFLWSSMPDEELFELARRGELTNPVTMRTQALRMLKDPKSVALVDNFAGQWLQLRDLERLSPDPELFATFDASLRNAMKRETEIFFEKMIKDDRNVVEFLTADYTFVNRQLAEHYGIPGVDGSEFQQVALPQGRRGVLTHASILLLTSNPTRTSPVKRGKWVLDNILAEPPPPPPPDVPELEEGGDVLGTLREQMEQHRANPACAVCHVKMDAIGFGMENFDAIGAWRDRDGRFDIDASGVLPGGHEFKGADELMQILAEEQSDAFCRCLARKLLTYAIGRELESFDRCAVNEIVSELEQNNYRFSALVTAIVTSDPFLLSEVR